MKTILDTSLNTSAASRLISTVLSDLSEYEQNLPGHGRLWFEKADAHRGRLLETDNAEIYDIQAMAVVDGNIGLSYLAGGSPDFSIASFKLLCTTFEDQENRSVWAANLSIAYRLNQEPDKSLEWAFKWTKEVYGEDSLSMAM